jgi:HAMP domain-containing protein/HPt (histidine-containing phosphotransfer) domain-containing protein
VTAETSPPTPFQEPRRVRFGIKAELLLAFAAMTAMTVVASVVAWYAFAEVDRAVTRITGSSVPSMSRAHALAAEVTEITASAPVMMASATQEGRARARRALTATEEKLSSLMEELATLGADRAALRELQTLQADMAANLAALDGFVERRLTLRARREDAVGRLAATHRRVLETLEPLIDDAVFDTVMTSERIAQGTAGRITRLVDGGVANAQRLMEIKAEVNYAAGLLAEVANVSDPDLIEPIVERFVASSAALSRNLGALPDTPETARARREVEDLLSFGRGGDNIFETRRDELTGVAGAVSAAGLANGARAAHGRLLVTLAPLVDDAIFDVVISSEQAARDGQGAITRLVDGGVEKMRALLTMRADVNLAAGLLNEASGVSDGSLIQPLRERFIAARSRITRVLTRQLTTRDTGGLEEVVYSLVASGAGAGNVFELRRDELDQIAHAQDALGEGGAIAARLGDVTRRLVDVAQAASQDDRVRAQDTIDGGRILLLIIIAATVSGAISIVVFYVAPRVVQPLLDMTHAMVRLAAGDTSVTVPVGDRKDEVGQMAEAFKVFRDTAQARANLSRYFSPKLVEELAGRDQPLGPGAASERRGPVRRYRRLHWHFREPAAGDDHGPAARLSRPHGKGSVRAQWGDGEIHRRCPAGHVRRSRARPGRRARRAALRAGHARLSGAVEHGTRRRRARRRAHWHRPQFRPRRARRYRQRTEHGLCRDRRYHQHDQPARGSDAGLELRHRGKRRLRPGRASARRETGGPFAGRVPAGRLPRAKGAREESADLDVPRRRKLKPDGGAARRERGPARPPVSRTVIFRWTAARKLAKVHRDRGTETRTETKKRLEWKTLRPIRLYWAAR